MKKKWFALLCSLLMLLPLASPVRATSYPASDIPNQVTEAGQQAIIDYFTRDGETNIPAIAALYDLNVPAAEQVDYILLYAYEHGTSYDGAYTGRVYLIEDTETIRQLCEALSNCGAQAATINPTVTGYDIGDYITEFSLEIHSGKQVSTYNTLYGLDDYLMMLDGKELGDYTDVPFRCGNRQQQLLPLLELLQTLSTQDKGELVSVLKDSPSIRLVDKMAHTYTTTDGLTKEARAPIDQALQALSCTALSLDELEQATSTAPYLTLSSGYGRLRLEQKGDAALLTLESDSVNAPQMAVQLADDQLWQAVEQSLNGAAQHPSWLYKLIDAPSVRVSFQRQTGVEDFPAVTDTSRSPYVQKMLGDITVQPGSFERVSKDKTLKGAVSFEADNVSHYQISMTESQLLIQNDSVSYGALFALEDGEKTLQALKEALGIF